MVVVKVDVYGYGFDFVVLVFVDVGVDWFGVVDFDEGFVLCVVGIISLVFVWFYGLLIDFWFVIEVGVDFGLSFFD